MTNAFIKVFNHRLTTVKRPFLARGSSITRCQHCMIATSHCVCAFLKPLPSSAAASLDVDITLLMHRDEILKPTNTGRLAADAFPDNCFVFEWTRLEPPKELLALLQDPQRQCVVIYPATESRPEYQPVLNNENDAQKRLTIIVLDGTWRQAARMMNHSQWLAEVPSLSLNIEKTEEGSVYAMRKATQATRLSTAEATAIALTQVGQGAAGFHLLQLFSVFNSHYHATRACIPAPHTDAHEYMASLSS